MESSDKWNSIADNTSKHFLYTYFIQKYLGLKNTCVTFSSFIFFLFSFLSFFFFFFSNHRITIHNNRSKSNTLPQTRIYFKILRYCIILRAMSTKNGHKRGHRILTYYFINFNGKISAVFVTQDSELHW